MPKLFEWIGLTFFFYSNEHEPIHVHVICEDRETIVEILIDNGIVTGFNTRANGSRPMLTAKEEKQALKLIRKYRFGIIERWVKFFIWQKPVRAVIIKGKTLPS